MRLRHEHRSKQIVLTGLSAGTGLYQIGDSRLHAIALPPEGLLLTMGVTTCDTVTLEVLEGARQVREVAVAGLSGELIGIGAYMDARALAGLLREDSLISGACLGVDPVHAKQLYARFKRMPVVSGVAIRSAMVSSVKDIIDRSFTTVSMFEMVFAAIIIGGMVYNSVRIALSERGNELASLRLPGFT